MTLQLRKSHHSSVTEMAPKIDISCPFIHFLKEADLQSFLKYISHEPPFMDSIISVDETGLSLTQVCIPPWMERKNIGYVSNSKGY